MSRCSASRLSIRERAPVEMMTESAVWVGSAMSGSPTQMPIGRAERSTRLALTVSISAPKRAAWVRMSTINIGPMIPSGKPG